MDTCEETMNRGDSRVYIPKPCGREAIAWEIHGWNEFSKEKAYCKIHCQAAIDKRRQRSQEQYDAVMAPKYYAWAAVEACRELGLSLEDLKAGKLQQMVKEK